ncbi:hypothetical protein [Kutzneria sp. CA-103260]|uniref:hypothetical protein n=1 Tax=Kutzneria sp. CA-103260 TaxID=2802641 RepID=UPI001BADAE80|nr:hypothetical protein [Kutzneria sp. CA-103260]QUQ71649.1 hypothetical protein JJ691_94360 [Kutzneria sp. CA-103260]
MALLAVLVLLAIAAGSLLVLTRRRPVARTGPPIRERPHDVVWVDRAELAVGELSGRPCRDDAEDVLAELRAAAAEVETISRALAALRASRLRRTRDQLATRLAADAGGGSELSAAHRAVCDRLATVERLRATRDALTTRMHACVTGLERVRDSQHVVGPVPGVELVELRANLAEVRVLAARLPDITAQGRP